jgi:predicted TIM-barrel fold metal-dependent hydrolase
LRPRIERLIEAFGVERVFWGSDLTRSRLSYQQSVALFTEQLPFLQGQDLAQVMSRSVSDWLDWPDPAGSVLEQN